MNGRLLKYIAIKGDNLNQATDPPGRATQKLFLQN